MQYKQSGVLWSTPSSSTVQLMPPLSLRYTDSHFDRTISVPIWPTIITAYGMTKTQLWKKVFRFFDFRQPQVTEIHLFDCSLRRLL